MLSRQVIQKHYAWFRIHLISIQWLSIIHYINHDVIFLMLELKTCAAN